MDTRTREGPKNKLAELSRRELELIDEIVATAERISCARSPTGIPIVRRDPIALLLRAIARSEYCCAIADVARLLRVTRQRAHQIARGAERIGAVELLANPDDRRIVQVFLTRAAREELGAAKSAERAWAAALLLGLDEHAMTTTTRVLRVIRQRLMRDERGWIR
jgi:DNA-binding MarR family transcriptional regulator